jgi:hypothetical protein
LLGGQLISPRFFLVWEAFLKENLF